MSLLRKYKNNSGQEVSIVRIRKVPLTQLTTGGSREAEIAMPISGPALPWSKAKATPVPDVKAHKTPIHNDLTFPLKLNMYNKNVFLLLKLCLGS